MSQRNKVIDDKFCYANGLTVSQCKKVCQFIFQDFFDRVQIMPYELCFYIYLYDKIKDESGKYILLEDFCDLQHFKNFWELGGQGHNAWKLKRTNVEDI
jgi:hypothetical protein